MTAEHTTGPLREAFDEKPIAIEAPDALFDGPKNLQRATYKVVVHCWPQKSALQVMAGNILVVHSGSRFSGNADESCVRCPREVPAGYRKGCGGLIPPTLNVAGTFACPSCKLVGPSEWVSERTMFARCSKERVAKLIAEFFHLCGGDADVHLKRFKYPIRRAAEAGRENKLHQMEALRRQSRGDKDEVLYPLKHILQDQLSGCDLNKRFLALLSA